MPFALGDTGRPLLLLSNVAMHTQNLKADPRCSLFVGQASVDGDPLGFARAIQTVCVDGQCHLKQIDPTDAACRERWQSLNRIVRTQASGRFFEISEYLTRRFLLPHPLHFGFTGRDVVRLGHY